MKIAFVDHLFHKKTKSSIFFVDIISQGNDIVFFYSDDNIKDNLSHIFSDINSGNFDCVIFWQIMPHYKLFPSLIADNIILIPMYDACHNWKYLRWRKYQQFRFISFSKILHNKLVILGIDSFYIPYMPSLPETFDSKNICKSNQSVFVWNRKGSIQIDKVFRFAHKNRWNRIVFHEAYDSVTANTKEEHIIYKELQVEKTTWFKDQEEYLKTITSCDVYISPREYEGIGLSFLEAMSRGLCVVAKNNPTMNEYIQDGFNGVLFNSYKKLSNRKITNLIQIKENAFVTCNTIREEYNRTIPLLLQFIYSYTYEKKNNDRYNFKFLIVDITLYIKQYYKALLRRVRIIGFK